jgi:hypothetical protein
MQEQVVSQQMLPMTLYCAGRQLKAWHWDQAGTKLVQSKERGRCLLSHALHIGNVK